MPQAKCNFCGDLGCKRRHSYRDQSGYVLAQVTKGRIVGGFAYYDGDGEWTTENNAQVYYTLKAARAAKREALPRRDDGVEDVALLSVWVT